MYHQCKCAVVFNKGRYYLIKRVYVCVYTRGPTHLLLQVVVKISLKNTSSNHPSLCLISAMILSKTAVESREWRNSELSFRRSLWSVLRYMMRKLIFSCSAWEVMCWGHKAGKFAGSVQMLKQTLGGRDWILFQVSLWLIQKALFWAFWAGAHPGWHARCNGPEVRVWFGVRYKYGLVLNM